jgi:predicted nucleic acid-binding protein
LGPIKFLSGSVIYLDTAPFFYSVEKHTYYSPLFAQFWTDLDTGKIRVVTSELTLLEVLVQPIRLGREDLIEAYDSLLIDSDLQLVPIDSAVLRKAAELRAHLNLKTPDSIHAATALRAGCDHLVSNDGGLRRLNSIEVTILSDLI